HYPHPRSALYGALRPSTVTRSKADHTAASPPRRHRARPRFRNDITTTRLSPHLVERRLVLDPLAASPGQPVERLRNGWGMPSMSTKINGAGVAGEHSRTVPPIGARPGSLRRLRRGLV